MHLLGKWAKITAAACAQKYPGTIAFKPNGLYQAEAEPDAAVHPVWDVGTFTVKQGTVALSTATDAVIAYSFLIKGNTLIIKDGEGCEIRFQAVA